MAKSINQLLKPITTKINNQGNIEIGGCDLTQLASDFKTPLYVIDEKTLRSICADYKKAFSNYPKIKFLYASKALCTSAIIKILEDEGFGFDTVSEGEMFIISNSKVNMSKVLINGNNKSFDEILMAIDLGVNRISIDNFDEIIALNKACHIKNKSVNVFLRITPGIECHTHEYIQTGNIDSKFGFDLSQVDSAIELILKECPFINIKGFHAHIGSQIFETKIFEDEIEILISELVRINKKFNLNLGEINLGGGIGVKYTFEDEPPSIYEIGELITNKLLKTIEKYNINPPVVYLEPGRSIISTAGVTIYKVGDCKQVPNGRKYVSVDGGMADNPRPSLYQAKYLAEKVSTSHNDNFEKVTLAGRFCESGDILIKDIELPKLAYNDIICVYNTGAYNYSMASNYNKVPKPAMVLVNNGNAELIIKRETLNDLISHDIIPDRLKK